MPTTEPYAAKWLSFDLSLPDTPPVPKAPLLTRITESPVDTPLRLFNLFSNVLQYFIAHDPDDIAVRTKCREEGVVLDELVVPLPILLARLAKGSVSARLRLRDWIFPQDLYARSRGISY